MLIGEAAKSVVTKQLEDFRDTATDIQPLLIISYDQVRQQINILENIPFALVICDEVKTESILFFFC